MSIFSKETSSHSATEYWYICIVDDYDDNGYRTKAAVLVKAATRGKARAEATWQFNMGFVEPISIRKLTDAEIREQELDKESHDEHIF